jgi:hypothetical protein
MAKAGNKGKRGKTGKNQTKIIVIDNETGKAEEEAKPLNRLWWTHRRAFKFAYEIEELGAQYIESWEAQNKPLTVVGLILYLGVNKNTFARYLKGGILGVMKLRTILRF